jgi:hypothetical protein
MLVPLIAGRDVLCMEERNGILDHEKQQYAISQFSLYQQQILSHGLISQRT